VTQNYTGGDTKWHGRRHNHWRCT